MNKKFNITSLKIILLTVVLSACSKLPFDHFLEDPENNKPTPPGMVKYSDNIYIDKDETTNFNWLEYSSWCIRKYGKHSTEYKEATPNTECWKEFDSTSIREFEKFYLMHPAYRDYPVVGISYQQAIDFCEWRADRIFEYVLVTQGIIGFDSIHADDVIFTIEEFYQNPVFKDYHHLPYPKIDLIEVDFWPQVKDFSDSLLKKNISSCKQRSILYKFGTKDVYCTDIIKDNQFIYNTKKDGSFESGDLTAEVKCSNCKKDLMFHVIGNVSEMTKDSTLVYGGSFQDKYEDIENDPFQKTQLPNCFTGFRSTVRWVKYDGSK